MIYVARGPALSERLSDRRVERTLEQIQPMLRQGRYADAIVDMVERIHFDILHGDSHDCRVPYRFLLGMGLCFVAQLALSSAIEFAYRHRVFRSKPKEQQWSELDRIHAESLKSRFQAYSCPICLNGFRGSHVGADDKPLKLLRCGHVLDTTCWDAWEMACLLNGSAAKCPICRHDGELADICGPTSIHSQVANH